jgi:hypothetical protein
MKEKKFYLKLGQAFEAIDGYLRSRESEYVTHGPSFAINVKDDDVDTLKNDIDGIIKDSFNCKVSKYRKYNYHQQKLYLQFKRRVG